MNVTIIDYTVLSFRWDTSKPELSPTRSSSKMGEAMAGTILASINFRNPNISFSYTMLDTSYQVH
jgi:hypothetical protein